MMTAVKEEGKCVEPPAESESKQSAHKRKRQLYKSIVELMEFYFGDSNLSRDFYVKKLIDSSPDGYVDISHFMTFNKIRKLNVKLDDVTKAISKSTMLTLNKERSKVKRVTAYQPRSQAEIDSCTVYVEGIPKTADHDWVKEAMSAYGAVNYVSLPKFKSTQDLKGFAFVEFATAKLADKCLATIGTHEFSSLNAFPKKGSKDIQRMQKAVDKNSSEIPSVENGKTKKKGKRKSSSAETPAKPAKSAKATVTLETVETDSVATSESNKPISEESSKEASNDESNNESTGKKRKRKNSAATESTPIKLKKTADFAEPDADNIVKAEKTADFAKPDADNIVKAEEVTDANKKKRSKKNKKAEASRKEQKKAMSQSLKAISKTEWAKLKGDYLAIQKMHMASLKRHIKEQRAAISADQNLTTNPAEKTGQKAAEEIAMVENVVVQFSTSEPLTREKLKEQLPENVKVSYIDISDEKRGYIRCASDTDASTLLNTSNKLKFKLLQGDEEQEYWKKLNEQRKIRLKAKKPKVRGTQKVIQNAEKYLKKVKKTSRSKPVKTVFEDSD